MFEVQMTKPRVDLSEMAPGDVDFHATVSVPPSRMHKKLLS